MNEQLRTTARVEPALRDVEGCGDPPMDAMAGLPTSLRDTVQVTVAMVAAPVR